MRLDTELLRAAFPLTARHHFVACARLALHWATFPAIFAASLVAALIASDDDLEGY